jgi:PGF-CTERM protein
VLYDSDDEVVASTTVTLDGSGEGTFSFAAQEEGNYTVEATDVQTGVSQETDTVVVTEAAAGSLDLAESTTTTAQGDVAEITVELDATTTGYVVIGDADDAGYQANVSVTDGNEDGEVTLQFNTYNAGNDDSYTIVSAAADDDSATLNNAGEDVQLLSSILDDGDYAVYVASETTAQDTIDNADTIGTLVVEPRDAPEMTLWRTSLGTASDIADAIGDDDVSETDAITTAVEDGDVTETGTVALDADGTQSDVLVHELTAPGLEGGLDRVSADDATDTEALWALLNANANNDYTTDKAATLVFEQQNPGRNADPKTVDVAADLSEDQFTSAFTVVYDNSTSSYYILVDQDELNDATADAKSFADGDELEASFTLQDDYLLQGSHGEFESTEETEDAFEEANSTFDVEEAEGEFDETDGNVSVTATEDASISGTTNVAPGTEFDLRLRSTGDTEPRFVKTTTVNVTADGTFSASFDFSDQQVGDTFSAESRQAAFDAASVGLVVEAEEETPTETTEATTEETTEATTEATTEETTEATTEAPTTTTEGDTPGFGAVLALVAVLAAALLATRRDE